MYESLFEPIKIGTVEIKNRVAVAPMNQQGDRDGHPTLQYTCFFSSRALGGFGLMTTGSILTSREAHKEYSFVPYIFPTAFNAGYWTDFVEGVHSQGTGAKLFAQMSPGFGRQTGMPDVRGASPIPFDREEMISGYSKESSAWMKYHVSEFAEHLVRCVPREMTVEEIHKEEAALSGLPHWQSSMALTASRSIHRTATCCMNSFRPGATSAKTSTAGLCATGPAFCWNWWLPAANACRRSPS